MAHKMLVITRKMLMLKSKDRKGYMYLKVHINPPYFPVSIYRNMFLNFMVINGDYIVKISNGIVKLVSKVKSLRFLKVLHKVPLITIKKINRP